MKHGSLFSGIGGFDLAAEWMGWENVFHCEWNEFGQKVLKHYWPQAKSYNDITQTDFTIHRGNIDILTGGFPCQPYSLAGKRKGKEDERHLWPEMLRSIREIQPCWVVGENVLGLVNWSGGMVFHEVQADLEAEGYEVFPYVLPACAVNAPHRRDRIWFVAKNTKRNGCIQREFEQTRAEVWQQRYVSTGGSDRLYLSKGDAANTYCNGCHKCNGNNEKHTSKRGFDAQRDIEPVDKYASNACNKGLQRDKRFGENEGTNSGRQKSASRTTSQFHSGSNWQNFPTQSPICGGDDGLPSQLDGITFPKWRNESIKAYGNAIVPQVALQIFKAIDQYNLHQ